VLSALSERFRTSAADTGAALDMKISGERLGHYYHINSLGTPVLS
jgi:hypothetical protein